MIRREIVIYTLLIRLSLLTTNKKFKSLWKLFKNSAVSFWREFLLGFSSLFANFLYKIWKICVIETNKNLETKLTCFRDIPWMIFNVISYIFSKIYDFFQLHFKIIRKNYNEPSLKINIRLSSHNQPTENLRYAVSTEQVSTLFG